MYKKIWMGLAATIILVAIVTTTLFVARANGANAKSSGGDGIGQPEYWTPAQNGMVANVLARGKGHPASAVPYWSSSFTYKGTTYPYTMIGTNPAAGSATTTIQPIIVPISFTFSNGVTLDGSKRVQPALASPIFQNAPFVSGNTQYGDAIQRAEFWNSVSTTSPDYHVLLGKSTVLPTVSINVPKQSGQETTGQASGAPLGLVDINYVYPKVRAMISLMPLSATALPIFLTYNTFFYQGSTANCCILGYHDAVASLTSNQLNTYMVAAYSDLGIFSQPIADIHALSHELSEWMNDPFINNKVPNWTVPSAAQYGCSNSLETGDPLVGVAFDVNGYHPQDEALLAWFARQAPSPSYQGRYTYLGTFTTFSPSC